MKTLLIAIIRGYQMLVSPLLPPSCRFYPTCSEYMIEAILNYGVFKGMFYGVKRVLRCHPLCKGGYDPVNKGCAETKSL